MWQGKEGEKHLRKKTSKEGTVWKFKGSLDSADGRHPLREGNAHIDEAGARSFCKRNEWTRKLSGGTSLSWGLSQKGGSAEMPAPAVVTSRVPFCWILNISEGFNWCINNDSSFGSQHSVPSKPGLSQSPMTLRWKSCLVISLEFEAYLRSLLFLNG